MCDFAVWDYAAYHRALRHQLSGVPQLPQNLAPGAAAVPHCVQCTTLGAAIGMPQLEQNFAPDALGA